MRNNQPVSNHEFEFGDGVTLMSATDTQSHVTYANEAFLEVSGFDRSEIIGAPHNLVRHPDMPREAFADMWATLRAGQSWTALVKNRRKDGDHYWVRANATPMRRDGAVVGYMSVRTKPGRDEIAAAERVYAAFREGRQGAQRFHKGLIVRGGWLAWTSWSQLMPLRLRIRAGVVGVAAALLAAAAAGLSPALVAAVAAAAAVAGCWWLEAQIAAPLRRVLSQAQSVAAGNPEPNVDLDRVDEIGMLLRAVNQAGLNLRSLVDDVGAQVGGVRDASGEIASGNADLSRRTEAQASHLQVSASSMEQLTATVKHNSDTAQRANELAAGASDAASRGGTVVGQVVQTMESITTASRRISEIIGVIDGIAFQTNILALNAAVEAARAGEQGRGFAVVAAEVRNLAQRSAGAAREIKGLIGASVDQVEAGAKLVDAAGRSMSEIVDQVHRVSELIGEISHSSVEQTQGIGLVGQAVSELEQTTQQNAVLVEQSAAAAAGLAERAARLAAAVQVFKPPQN
ncbi:MAG: PAS domain-containing protein [Burkholderiales bacterium]|nr:PAS domain-containing protein [Burkholderiales bacterium]